MQLSDILAGGTQLAPSVLPPLGQMPGAPMPPLRMTQQMQAAPMAQQPAQIVERGVPAQPPMPQAQPQPQAPQGNPEWAARWQAIQQKLADPTIMGPLQTFFGVLSAPMGPGENVGSRMARASMMMRSHQQMLIENQKAQETADQDRQMKLEDRALAREEKQVNIKRLGVETTAKEQSMAPNLARDLQALEKERLIIENLPQVQRDAALNAQSTRHYQSAMAEKAGREPTTGKGKTHDLNALNKSWESNVQKPYLLWRNEVLRTDPNADTSLEAFYATQTGGLAKNFIQQLIDDKVPMRTRVLTDGSGNTSAVPVKKSYKLGADGKLQ